MANDTDIFGDAGPSKTMSDADIFKDLPASKVEAAPEPVSPQAPKGMFGYQMSPEQAAREKTAREQIKWGEGGIKAAYNAGGHITDLTGSPLLGAIVSALPEAAQMAIGGEIGKTAAPALEAGGQFLMRSASKPTLDQVKRGKAAPAVQTMLDEGLSPTVGGVEKAKSLLGDLSNEVDQKIANSGAQIDVHSVADYAKKAYDRFKNGPLAVPAIKDIGEAQTSLITHPNVAGARTIPVQVAQDMKSGYQRAVGDRAYGELKTPATEAEKQIARGFREEIGNAVPGVVEPLARESSTINALKMMERRVAVDANKNPIGLGWLGQPHMIPFWLWDRSAAAKALTARMLYSGSEMIPGSIGASMGALYSAMQQNGALSERK